MGVTGTALRTEKVFPKFPPFRQIFVIMTVETPAFFKRHYDPRRVVFRVPQSSQSHRDGWDVKTARITPYNFSPTPTSASPC